MSKKTEVSTEVMMLETETNNGIVPFDSVAELYGFNPFADDSRQGFEDNTVEFFDPNGMEGVEMDVFLKEEIALEINGESKKFVKGFLRMENGVRPFHFGQIQIINSFTRNDRGKGVRALVTFHGKVAIKGGKTMNSFSIFTKAL